MTNHWNKFIWVLLLLGSCCPKIKESISSTEKIDTVFSERLVPFEVPAEHDSVYLNFDEICDSIHKGYHPVITVSTKPHINSPKPSGSVTVDTQKGIVICNEDAWKDSVKVRDLKIFTMHQDVITKVVLEKPFWRTLCYILIGIVLISVGLNLYLIKK